MPKSEVSIAAGDNGPPEEPSFLQTHVDKYYNERRRDAGGAHILKGRSPDSSSILLTSNDYLAISGNPRIAQAQVKSLQYQARNAVMSAVFLHDDSPQAQLEQRLAAHMRMEDAVLCQSGYAANTGLLQTIATPELPVYIDMEAHASLWEGAHGADASIVPFRHNSADHLARQISRHGPGIVVADSVYSTSGSIAPLTNLIGIAERNGCVSVIDESHSLGTHGDYGEGIVASLGLSHRVHFITASLAKAFAGRAGLIACSSRLSEFITYQSFPAIFSSALLPSDVAALDATLDVVRDSCERRRRLRRNTNSLRGRLDALGYNVDASEAQIISLQSGPEAKTIVLRDALESNGVFGSVFCAPATARNRSLVRFSVNAGLTSDEIDRVIEVCRDVRDEVGLEDWPSTRRRLGRLSDAA